MTSGDLNQYVYNTNSPFQKAAMELYLENARLHLFPDVARPLIILRYMYDVTSEQQHDLFLFMDNVNEYIRLHRLTAHQQYFVLKITRKYLENLSKTTMVINFPQLHTLSLPFFTLLEEAAATEYRKQESLETDSKAQALEALKIQLLVLSEDIHLLPIEKRVKVLATLVRLLAQYEKLTKAEENPKRAPNKRKEALREAINTSAVDPAETTDDRDSKRSFPLPHPSDSHQTIPVYPNLQQSVSHSTINPTINPTITRKTHYTIPLPKK